MDISIGLNDDGTIDIQLYIVPHKTAQVQTKYIYQVVHLIRLMQINNSPLTIHFLPTLTTVDRQLYQNLKEAIGRG